jgi:predicted nucleotidyltransferase component of viral defense system
MSNGIGKSVRARLLNISKTYGEKDGFMKLLVRYLHERLIYRISVSRYRENFFLKGGSLLFAYNGMKGRPTQDIDFLAAKISRDAARLKEIFAEICQIECEEDGVIFDAASIRTAEITQERKYPGTRVIIVAHLDTIVQQISADIGFGDVIVPAPVDLDYPVFLDTTPPISIKAYSLETVVAEKFHAMVEKDTENSRMKDFFDCYQILIYQSNLIDEAVLEDAIRATFENRDTVVADNLQLFTDAFSNDDFRNSLWKNFLKKINWQEQIEFAEVMKVIQNRLGKFV